LDDFQGGRGVVDRGYREFDRAAGTGVGYAIGLGFRRSIAFDLDASPESVEEMPRN
jgi:hypothetical protein